MSLIKSLIQDAYGNSGKTSSTGYLQIFKDFMEDGTPKSKMEIAEHMLETIVLAKLTDFDEENEEHVDFAKEIARKLKKQVDLIISHSLNSGSYSFNKSYNGVVEKTNENGIVKYYIDFEGDSLVKEEKEVLEAADATEATEVSDAIEAPEVTEVQEAPEVQEAQ